MHHTLPWQLHNVPNKCFHVCCSEQCSMYDTEAGWVPLEGNTDAAEGGMCMG